jgi:putative ABC transport system substrate-binding protein
MDRRRFVAWIGGALAAPLARAQTPDKMRRIGWISGGSLKSHAKFLQAFRDGLKEHGWLEGRSITLELRWAEGHMDRLPLLAAELVRVRPDVIVSAGNVVHLVVRKETSTIPIVMATSADPVEAGLVASLARPGSNVTGLSSFFEATPIKMLELAASIVPRGARVAVLVDVSTPFSSARYRAEIERAAKAVGMRTEFIEAAAPQDASRVLDALRKNPPAALVVLPSPMFLFLGGGLVKSAEAVIGTVIYPFEEMVEAGGLMSFAAPMADNYRRAAYYVDRILRGAKPGELPIEQPTRLSLAVNLKTARGRGIRIPQEILLRAERVIE